MNSYSTSWWSLLLIYRPREDERLSWLTYSGRFTHIDGYPSAAGPVQTSESSPMVDQPTSYWIHLSHTHTSNQTCCCCCCCKCCATASCCMVDITDWVAWRWSPTARLCKLAATFGADGVRGIVDIMLELRAEDPPTAAHVTISAAC